MKFTRAFTDNAPGSVLTECGRTKVLCTVSIQEQVPQWMYGRGGGWLTAEYSMLPGSTAPRKIRDGRTGRGVDGRSYEIQRLVGRSLRCAVDMSLLPEVTLWVDCDVLSADGGTRTTAINGATVALYDALLYMEEQRSLRQWPLTGLVSATSVGLIDGTPLADLDYEEDVGADVDLNVVATSDDKLIEVQGTAEGKPFDMDRFQAMMDLALAACREMRDQQKRVLGI